MSDFLLLLLILVLFRGESFGRCDFSQILMQRFMGDRGQMQQMLRGFLQGGPVQDPGSLMQKLQDLTGNMDPAEVERLKQAALGFVGEKMGEPETPPESRTLDGFGAKLELLAALEPLLTRRQGDMIRQVTGGMRTMKTMETGAAEWKL